MSKVIEVTKQEPGHHHVKYWGRCSADVTVQDIKDQFYHPYLGGRDARVENGTFFAIRHTS